MKETHLGSLLEMKSAHQMVKLKEMSWVHLLDCLTVLQMAQMKGRSLELLMEIRWEKLMVMLKVTSLVHLTVE